MMEVMANPKWLGDFEAWEDLAPTLEPFLASQVALFLRWSDANAKALLAGQKEGCHRRHEGVESENRVGIVGDPFKRQLKRGC